MTAPVSSGSPPVVMVREGGQVTLTLNRPERGNALGPDLVEALLQHLTATQQESQVHTVVLRGAGRHFCTGMDLSDLAQCSDGDLLHRIVRIEALLSALWHASIRTVAVAQGRAWGAGADLFASCERRIAAPDGSFRFPGVQFGIVLGTRRLSERIGAEAARSIVLEGAEWDTPRALAIGLVQAQTEPPEGWGEPPVADAITAAAIRRATRADSADADLAALVRSAARPGLVARITAYRDRLRRDAAGRS